MPSEQPWTLWLTGLPGSGKTTLAWRLKHTLAAQGIQAIVLDSDELRPLLAPGAAFAPVERDAFYRRLVQLATWLSHQGANCIISATGNSLRYRDAARAALHPFAEVWLRCPREVCEQRDVKGLYAGARAGTITELPGVGIPYEPPVAPDLVVDTDLTGVPDAAALVMRSIPFLKPHAVLV